MSLFAVTSLQSKQIGAWPVLEILQEKATLFLKMSSALYLSFNLLTKGREYNACEIFNFSIFPVHWLVMLNTQGMGNWALQDFLNAA